jgi:hypothetical protein
MTAPLRPLRLGADCHTGAPVLFTPEQRKKHVHIIGSSGTGKSFAMLHMILQDIADPACGVTVFDPHGALIDAILLVIAHRHPELAERVILFDPSGETDHVLGFNPLGDAARLDPDAAVNLMVSSCLKAWGARTTDDHPRIARWLRNIFAVIVANRLTLAEAVCLLDTSRNNPHRRRLLAALTDQHILADWDEFEKMTGTMKSQMLEGCANRLVRFLSNQRLMRTFGIQSAVLSPQRVIEEKKVLLVNLRPSIHVDEESTRLLGVLLVNEFYRVALLREPEPYGKPHPFFCYVDECYHYVSRSIAQSLDGTRKFGLYYRLAHQHLEQLRAEDDQLPNSVLTNCKARIVFGGLCYEDAETMACELYTDPDVTQEVKYVERRLVYRQVEEADIRYTFTGTHTDGRQASENRSSGHTVAANESEARSQTVTRTDTASQAHTHGHGQTVNSGVSLARQQGTSHARAEMAGRSEGLSANAGHSTSDGLNTTDAHGASEQHSATRGQALQSGQSISYPGSGGPPSLSRSGGISDSAAQTTGGSTSQSHSEGRSHATTDSQNFGLQAGRQTATTHTTGGSASATQTASRGVAASSTHSRTVGHATAIGQSTGSTRTRGKSVSDTEQKGTSSGTSSSDSAGIAVAVGTRFRPVADTEETVVKWTLAEQRYRQVCGLKDLPMATAVVRLENGPVRLTRIDHVSLPPIRPKYTAHHRRVFRQDVIDAHPDCYLSWDDARYEIEQRQLALFQTTFTLGFPEPIEPANLPVTGPSSPPAPATLPGNGPVPDAEPADPAVGLPPPGWTPFESLS